MGRALTTSGLERALHDLDLAGEHGGHVEADLHRPHAGVVGEPAGSEVAEPRLLGPGDGLDGRAEGIRAAALHLAEHESPSPADDQVELAVTASPIAGHDVV